MEYNEEQEYETGEGLLDENDNEYIEVYEEGQETDTQEDNYIQEEYEEKEEESTQEIGEKEQKEDESESEETVEERSQREKEELELKEVELACLREKQEQARQEIDEKTVTDVQTVGEFIDEDGDVIPARQQGQIRLEMLDIETQIRQVKRIRQDESDVYDLEDLIRKDGLISPVHVVPYGNYYILLDGYRRLQACINLGKKRIPAIIDETIPPELVKFFQAEVNNVKGYTFIEKLEYGKYVEQTQEHLGVESIERALGLKSGEYLKMKYIEQFKDDFPEIFQQVQTGKLTIEQAYKKIDKEIEKQQKEIDALNNGEMDDKLKDENELNDIQGEANKQELGNRKLLDPVTRRSVESRANGTCECCGYGAGEPDLMGAFQVHHIIAVQYGGSDAKTNLILLCHNCHKLVHDYESARFMPEQETYDRLDYVQKIVVLGNMLLEMRKRAIHVIKAKHPNIARQLDKGVTTIGKAIQKVDIDLKGEDYFGGSPYDTFLTATESLLYGGNVTGELAGIDAVKGIEEEEEKEEQQEQE